MITPEQRATIRFAIADVTVTRGEREYQKMLKEVFDALQRAEAALQFYADKRNYLADIEDDMGERARAALVAIEEAKP